MRESRTNKCFFVIREGDSSRKGIIEAIIICLFLLSITPWFLRVRPVFLFWCYGMLALVLVLNLIYWFQIKDSAKEILFLIDRKGITIKKDRSLLSLSWDEIECLSVQMKKVPYRNNQEKWVFFFFVKPKSQKEVGIPFSDYVVFMPIAIGRIKRVIQECSDGEHHFSCNIPLLRQIFW